MEKQPLHEIKRQMDKAHENLIESPQNEVSKRLEKYLELKEKYFETLSR